MAHAILKHERGVVCIVLEVAAVDNAELDDFAVVLTVVVDDLLVAVVVGLLVEVVVVVAVVEMEHE